jgi:phosphohistidine phosphatase
MERQLIVMRHAKSSWSSSAATDHERPLNDRGRREAPVVAKELARLGWIPEMVLSSDSQRTRETWEHMRKVWSAEPAVEFLRSLYLAGYADLIELTDLVPEHIKTLLVLGHNPGWQGVVYALTGESIAMKTACAARLLGPNSDWDSALRTRGTWKLIDVIRGKD